MLNRISSIAIPANSAWKIANEASDQALICAAVRIVMNGGDYIPDDDALNADGELRINLRTDLELGMGLPAVLAPTATFGDLQVVDRDEIEGYRSIHQLLHDYMSPPSKDKSDMRPISIGAFGPPGSGKSFGVKCIANLFRGANSPEPLEFNLAQFSSANELGSAFLTIQNQGKNQEVPVAIFDEFDSSLGGVELGWLRYFLAPMEDGEFFFEKERRSIGKAIFVFAGGTSASLRQFAREEGSSEQERVRFVAAKGPDFVSRLSGNINVLGVNLRDDMPADQSFVLRRAVVIRSHLKRMDMVGLTKRCLVDGEFVKTLLAVGRYKHGARSIGRILRMCVGPEGILHLPPVDQLMMHVDKTDADKLLS